VAKSPTAPVGDRVIFVRASDVNGIVGDRTMCWCFPSMWRAFVYNADVNADRLKRAYMEFVLLDGRDVERVRADPRIP
jgi:hypothetical protein